MRKLLKNYYYKIVSREEVQVVFKDKINEVFRNENTIYIEKYFSETEKAFKFPKSDVFRLNILVYHKDEIIGWHIGFQKANEYYMMNTGILKDYQGNGIYTKLLREIIEIIKPKGFLYIKSHHLASNNQVIIPKLKAGFVITGMDINERFGILVRLKYFFNEKIKDVYLMRTGKII